jgi:Zn-dependent protease/CBS domain-containing protein
MRGFRLGRIFGIDLRIDYSWLFIFILLTWNLVHVFSVWHPDWTIAGAFAVALSASLLFFFCVLLHELAHSVVAMRFGVPVRSITLFLFGGVSNIEREPPSAKAEFLTAIVGPVTSVVLGVIFIMLASLGVSGTVSDADAAWRALAQLGPLQTLLVWLGPVNVVIGLFNLIPGFPLDGGRVLRSILWRLSGDFRKSTLWASSIGQIIGWLFIAGGIAMTFGVRLPFFGTGIVGGLWLAFIGWFLHAAAQQASTRVAVDEALAGMTVEQLMRRDLPSVAPETTVAELVHERLLFGDDRTLPVARDGTLLGLVSVGDVREVPTDRWAVTPVESVMHGADSLFTGTPTQPLTSAFEQLSRQDLAQMPVLDHGRFVGVLRRRDVTRWLELAWHGSSAWRGPRPTDRDLSGDRAHRAT